MAAAATQTPELKLDSDEAQGMAKAIAEVARHYPTKVDPKTLAWVNLIMALMVVYGPRIYLIRERHKSERAERRGSNEFTTTDPDVTRIVPGMPMQPQEAAMAPPMAQDGTKNAADVPFLPIPGVRMAGLDG